MTNPIKTLWSEDDIRAMIRRIACNEINTDAANLDGAIRKACQAVLGRFVARQLLDIIHRELAKQSASSALHRFAGSCPDTTQPQSRDPECPACAAMSQPAEAKLWPPLREAHSDSDPSATCVHFFHDSMEYCDATPAWASKDVFRCADHPPPGYQLRQPAAEQPAPTPGREATESELLGIASVWFGETGYATSTIHADKARRVIAAVRKIGLGCDCAERIEDLTGSLACEILRAEQAEAELAKLREATIKPAPVTCAECGDVGYRVMCQKCEPYWKNVPGSCDGSHVEIIAQSAETAELLEARIAKLERQLAEAPTHGREATVARLEEILESWHEAARECFPDADEEELMVDFIRRQHRELESERRVGDENKRRLFEIYAVADSVVAPKSENVTKLIPRLHHELTTMRNLVNRATSILNRTAGEAVREWMRDARKALEVKP